MSTLILKAEKRAFSFYSASFAAYIEAQYHQAKGHAQNEAEAAEVEKRYQVMKAIVDTANAMEQQAGSAYKIADQKTAELSVTTVLGKPHTNIDAPHLPVCGKPALQTTGLSEEVQLISDDHCTFALNGDGSWTITDHSTNGTEIDTGAGFEQMEKNTPQILQGTGFIRLAKIAIFEFIVKK